MSANLHVLQSSDTNLFLTVERREKGLQIAVGRPDGSNSATVFFNPTDQRVTSIVISSKAESFKGQIVDQNADGIAETRVSSDGKEEVLLDGTWVVRTNDGEQVQAVIKNQKVPIEFRGGKWFKKTSD